MTTEELSKHVASIVVACQARVCGTGARQYSDADGQLFEKMSPEQLLLETRDEAYDIINYGVMLVLRIEQIRERMLTRVKAAA
jgi:hypothetical protein